MEPFKWSGVTSDYAHKWNPQAKLPKNTKIGVRKVWLLDAQWSTCPVEVETQVKVLWDVYELGNHNHIINTSFEELNEMHDNPEEYVDNNNNPLQTHLIVQYLREMGVGDKDEVLIHWWW